MNSILGTSCEGRGTGGALGAVSIQSFDFLYIPFGKEWNALGYFLIYEAVANDIRKSDRREPSGTLRLHRKLVFK